MFGYYLMLAGRSLRRSPALAALMVAAIGLGIGASMTMLTVLHVMSGDPLPARSAVLFYPHIDPLPLNWKNRGGPDPSEDFSWPDAQNLLHAAKAERQAAMAGGNLPIHPPQPGSAPFFESGRYTTADFFAMFDAPFRYGAAWTAAEDEGHARIVVLNAGLSRRLFGDTNPIGRTLSLKDSQFRIVGVLDDWRPEPKFYADIGSESFGEPDQFFLPLSTAVELTYDTEGSTSCWGGDGSRRDGDQCTWLQFWVQLSSPAKAESYREFLVAYTQQQKAPGRFERPADARLYSLMDWQRHEDLIPGDVRLQCWLALGFLLVCVLNIVGLLLAKFLRRSAEVSVRRALGARRRDIFTQFTAEALAIGIAGGLLGLLLAQFGLWSIRQRADDYAHLARMDNAMLLTTFGLALLASLLAGALPAWRVCIVPPALQMKSL